MSRNDGAGNYGDNGVSYYSDYNGFNVQKDQADTRLYVEAGHLKFNNTVITDADSDANAVHFSNEAGTIPDGPNGEKITRIVLTSSDNITSGHIEMNNGGFEINQPLTTDQDINAGGANVYGANITTMNNGISANATTITNLGNTMSVVQNDISNLQADTISLQANKLDKAGGVMSGNLDFTATANLEMNERPVILNGTGAEIYANDSADTYITNSSNGLRLEAGGSNNMVLGSSNSTFNKQMITTSSLKFNTGNVNKLFFANNENGNKIDLQSGWIMGMKCGDSTGAQVAGNGKFSAQTANGAGGYTERLGVDCDNTLISNNLKLVNSSFQINNTDTIGADGTRLSYKGNDIALLSDISGVTSAHSEFINTTISNVDLQTRYVGSTVIDGRLAQVTKLTSQNYLTIYIYEKNSTTVHATITTDLEVTGDYLFGQGRPYIVWNPSGRYGFVGAMLYSDSTPNYLYRIKRFDYNRTTDQYTFASGYIDIPTPGTGADNIMLDQTISYSHTDSTQSDIWYCIYSYWNGANWEMYQSAFSFNHNTGTLTNATSSNDLSLNLGDFNLGVMTSKSVGFNGGVVVAVLDTSRRLRVYHIHSYSSAGFSNIITASTLNNMPYKTELSKSASPDVRLGANNPLYYTGGFDINNKQKFTSSGLNQSYNYDFDVLWSHRDASTYDIRTCYCNVKSNGTIDPDLNFVPPYMSDTMIDLMGETVASAGYKRRFFNSAIQNSTNTMFPGVAYNKKANVWLLYCNSSSTGAVYCFLDGDTFEPLNMDIQGMTKQYVNAPFYLYSGIGAGLYSNIVSSEDTIYNCYSDGWQAFTNLRYAT